MVTLIRMMVMVMVKMIYLQYKFSGWQIPVGVIGPLNLAARKKT